MPLHSLVQKLKRPKIQIEVKISEGKDHVYKPGDVVSGVVELSAPNEITVNKLEAYLCCQSQTWICIPMIIPLPLGGWITWFHHYRDEVELVRQAHSLLEDSKVQPGIQSYSFSFAVPERTEQNRVGMYDKPKPDVYVKTPQLLPPSFSAHIRWSLLSPGQCAIWHGVGARLFCSPADNSSSSSSPIKLVESEVAYFLFRPHNPNAHIQTPHLIRKTKILTLKSSTLASLDPESIGFRQQINDKLSSKTPAVDFEIGIEFPATMTAGEEFTFKTTLRVVDKDLSTVSIPAFTFIVQKLELRDSTFFRAPRDWTASIWSGTPRRSRTWGSKPVPHRPGYDKFCGKENKTELEAWPEQHSGEMQQTMADQETKAVQQGQECEVWFHGRVPVDTVPSFKSYSIARMYKVSVKLLVEFGGKKFHVELEGPDVNLGSP